MSNATSPNDATGPEVSIDGDDAVTDDPPPLEIRNLSKYYSSGGGLIDSLLRRDEEYVHAVDGVSLECRENEVFGLVGESGCGKSTLGRTLLRLEEPTGGNLLFHGEDITNATRRSLRSYRSELQFIHQDPSSSLNPRKRVDQILQRPLKLHTDLDADGRRRRIEELLDQVGLDPNKRQQYPHELSGGQRQRIEIARALSVNPSVIVADEPTSALDVTVQAQILELLEELQAEYNLTLVFISHDLRTVRYISDRIGVMYLGQLVEVGPTDRVFESPHHPYTQSLLSSIPTVGRDDRDQINLEGQPPDPIDPPSGCRFHTRCPVAQPVCSEVETSEHGAGEDHTHRCHFADTDVHEGEASNPLAKVRSRLTGDRDADLSGDEDR